MIFLFFNSRNFSKIGSLLGPHPLVEQQRRQQQKRVFPFRVQGPEKIAGPS